MKKAFLLLSVAAMTLVACHKDPQAPAAASDASLSGEKVDVSKLSGISKLFVLNEGNMGSNDASLDMLRISDGNYINGVFKKIPRAGFTAREKGALRRAVSDYMERGGFPDVQDVSDGMRASMLQGYVDAVLYRDIIERHAVPSVQALKYTLEYLFHNYARKTSTRSISGVLKNLSLPANRESIADYLDWFKDAYLAYSVSVRSDSLAVKRVNPD